MWESSIKPDTDEQHTCGTCLESKNIEEFYRDGKNAQGDVKYRRDCKDCYRKARLLSRRAKKVKPVVVAPKKRRR